MNQQSVSKIQRRGAARMNDFMEMHKNLNAFIDKINQKIVNRIQLVSSVYIDDYKLQIIMMTEQLKNMRHLLDQELLAQRSNQRLFYLEEERDFFRGKTLKMNEDINKLNKVNERLRQELDKSELQTKNYKNLVFSLQSKINRMQSQIFQTQKIRQIHTKMPLIAVQKQKNACQSLAATKQSLSKFSPVASLLLPQRQKISSTQLRHNSISKQINPEIKRRDQIVDECIKQIKKKIFYRTMSQSHSSAKQFFNQDIKVTFLNFKKTDKEQLIRLILSKDQLLDQFTNFIMNRKDDIKSSQKKFNKHSFNQKLFRLKLNGLQAQNLKEIK